MSETNPSTLKRLAGAGRPPPDHGVVSTASALRLAVSKAAQDVARAALAGGEVHDLRVTLGAMAQVLPEGGLCVLLQGPGRARGLLTLDQSLLSALVQALTTGRITGAEAPRRPPTQTDAILVRRFLTVLLETLAKRLAGHGAAQWATGFQPRDRVADPGRLPHLLLDVVYQGLSIEVDIADGLRQGVLCLILPETVDLSDHDAPDTLARQAFTEAIGRKIRNAPAELEAVLHCLRMSLAEVSALKPNMLLTLPRTALGEVTLVGCDGTRAGVARLGQSGGFRAVKLVGAPDLAGAVPVNAAPADAAPPNALAITDATAGSAAPE